MLHYNTYVHVSKVEISGLLCFFIAHKLFDELLGLQPVSPHKGIIVCV